MRLEANELIFTDTVVFIDYQRQIDSTFILQWFLILHRNVLQISVKKKQKQKQQPNNNKTGFFIHIQTLTWKFQSYAHMVCWQYSSRHCFSNKPLPSLASGGQCCSLPISFFPSSIWKEKKNNKRNKPGFQGATLKRTPLTLFLVLHRQFRIGKMHRNVPTVSYVLDVVN